MSLKVLFLFDKLKDIQFIVTEDKERKLEPLNVLHFLQKISLKQSIDFQNSEH